MRVIWILIVASLSVFAEDNPKPLPGLSAAQLKSFEQGLAKFREVATVSAGLGPRFNLNSCAGCHAQPSAGGSSPWKNPQIAVAREDGALNTIPSFLRLDGPIRVVRFAQHRDGRPDGGVHNLFTIAGRTDARGCNLSQPAFEGVMAQNNAFFRIPTPLYGAGLVEAISEASIMNNLRVGRGRGGPGRGGHENRNPGDGTITRFGWKAQDKSLIAFAGEALNVEEGITNDLFPHEREDTPGCVFNASPEDQDMTAVRALADFMRYLAPPERGPVTESTTRGAQIFAQIGCAACHTPTQQTGRSNVAALREKTVALYSDLAVHNMGTGLEDFITQGEARGRDWRTAPLWGLGRRAYLMHDGRTPDITQAIREHGSPGSEGARAVASFEALAATQKQELLDFLRSL